MQEDEDLPSMRLSPKRERAATLIAKGKGKAETGRDPKVGVSKATMQRWGDDPIFQRRVKELRTSIDLQATEILQQALTDAAMVISKILSGRAVAVYVACESCGADVTSAVVTDQRLIQKTAQWLLDTHYKGKISDPRSVVTEDDSTDDDDLDELTRSELQARGSNDEDDESFEDEE